VVGGSSPGKRSCHQQRWAGASRPPLRGARFAENETRLYHCFVPLGIWVIVAILLAPLALWCLAGAVTAVAKYTDGPEGPPLGTTVGRADMLARKIFHFGHLVDGDLGRRIGTGRPL
jgi:hypothetical protein